jgi:2',3'-cyclic-nucleotide 2'-phosphodiesterase (5'-nucleotidase family)
MEAEVITFNDLLNVLPFNNTGVVVRVSGQTILEMLELTVSKWPEENANFPHISGMTFFVNTLGDENGRVYNVKIMNSKTGEYEPLELDRMYSVASNNFILLECGDGMTMFENAEVISDTGILDVEILEKYLTDHLDGVIGEKYAVAEQHITFTEGFLTDYPYVTDGDHAVWIAVIAVILAVATVVVVLVIRKRRK